MPARPLVWTTDALGDHRHNPLDAAWQALPFVPPVTGPQATTTLEVQLRDSLTVLSATFAPGLATPPGPIPCADLFVESASLGVDASCALASAETLVVTLGGGATVLPGDTLTLPFHTPLAPAPGQRALGGLAAVVAAPSTPVVPVVQVVAPSAVTPCAQTATLEASAINLGNRQATWAWSVTGANPSQALLNRVAAATSPSLAIPDLELAGSTSLTFSASATNYVGASSTGRATIAVDATARPTIRALSSTTPSIERTSALLMQVSAASPPCLGTTAPTLHWTAEPSSAIPGVVTANTTLLAIPGGTLAPGDAPTYTATASLPALGTSASVAFDVTVARTPLVARIAGGASLVVPSSSTHPLDASRSYDPDAPDQKPAAGISFHWACRDELGADCGVVFPDAPIVSLPLPSLGAGTYEIALTATVPDGRIAHAAQTVTADDSACATPYASFTLPDERPNPDADFTLVAALFGGAAGSWSVTPTPADPTKVRTTASSWTAQAGALAPGTAYTVILGVQSGCGGHSTSSVSFTTNATPAGGWCEVVEAQPLNVGDAFTVWCPDFTDADAPLSYQVYRDDAGVRTALGPPSADDAQTVSLSSLADTLLVAVTDARGYAAEARVYVASREALGPDARSDEAAVLVSATDVLEAWTVRFVNTSALLDLQRNDGADDVIAVVLPRCDVLQATPSASLLLPSGEARVLYGLAPDDPVYAASVLQPGEAVAVRSALWPSSFAPLPTLRCEAEVLVVSAPTLHALVQAPLPLRAPRFDKFQASSQANYAFDVDVISLDTAGAATAVAVLDCAANGGPCAPPLVTLGVGESQAVTGSVDPGRAVVLAPVDAAGEVTRALAEVDLRLGLDASLLAPAFMCVDPLRVVSYTAGDGNGALGVYGAGDTLTVRFNRATSTPDVSISALVTGQLSFSRAPGTSYSGAWLDATTLQITVVAGSAVNAPVVGADTVTIGLSHTLDDLAPACIDAQRVALVGHY